MASFYPQEFLDRVRQSADIVQVVGEYVVLKKNGRRHWGLCPFHGEKTASFSVDEERQMYYCFGCHAAGNVFHFVMAMEHMEFAEAVAHLASRANLPLPEMEKGKAKENTAYKERLYEALTEAARQYYALLYQKEGQAALSYLHKRGLDDTTIRRFGLGATGEKWDRITTLLKEKGFSQKELTDAGLVSIRDNRAYDAFRNRAMFPIFNARGRVIGFGGRALGDIQPKYLNSAESSIFNKRYQLYGLNFIKGHALKEILLVEGYMDVVSLSQAGIQNAVATLGTALSIEQARLIKRYAQTVVLCYDGDAAGQRAILRCLDICAEAALPCRVRRIPDNLDPDEYVKAHGPKAFEDLGSLSPIQYRLQIAWEKVDPKDEDARLSFAIEASSIISKEKNPVLVEGYINRLEQQTGIRAQVLYQQMGLSQSEVPKPKPKSKETSPSLQDDIQKAAQNLLSLLALGYMPALKNVTEDDFSEPRMQSVAKKILSSFNDPQAASRALDEMEEEDRHFIVFLMQGDTMDSDEKREKVLGDSLQCLRLDKLEKQILTLQASMGNQSVDVQLKTLKEIQDLSTRRARMKNGRKE